MKRLFAALAVLILLTACVSGDYYTSSLSFIRNWNGADEVKENEAFKIDKNTLWHEPNGDKIRYAVWLEDDTYLLVLMCDPKTDYVHACSISVRCDDKGKLSEEDEKKIYVLINIMICAMNNMSSTKADELLKTGGFGPDVATSYLEHDFHIYSMITDALGMTFRIENQRLSPKLVPDLTLVADTTKNLPSS